MKRNRPIALTRSQKRMLSGWGLNPNQFWYLRDEEIEGTNYSVFKSKLDGTTRKIENIR